MFNKSVPLKMKKVDLVSYKTKALMNKIFRTKKRPIVNLKFNSNEESFDISNLNPNHLLKTETPISRKTQTYSNGCFGIYIKNQNINKLSKTQNKKSTKIKHIQFQNRTNLSNQAYYLSGEIPLQNPNTIGVKNKFNKTENNITYKEKNVEDKILQIKKNDQKIEELAKILNLKLNDDNTKNKNETKCGCGNLITLNNGFYNGMNLVMDYSTEENKDKQIDGYNFYPTNLPFFLREKYNIKGTNILSPFCIKIRDYFLFKRIFYDNQITKRKKKEIIDNKLNIIYSESQKQFEEKLKILNKRLKDKGKNILHTVGPSSTEKRLTSVVKNINFMKKIVDYSYPNMVMARVRESQRILKRKRLNENRYKQMDCFSQGNKIKLQIKNN